MKKPVTTPPELHLYIQYAVPAPELPRWRIRRWVQRAVSLAADDRRCAAEPGFQRAELTVRLVDTNEALALNSQYRGRDYATNVLTFEYGIDADGTARGDIILCVTVLHDEAREQGKPLLHHAAHLIIHGVFHALGYDHLEQTDAEHMEQLETQLLNSMRIPDPYQP